MFKTVALAAIAAVALSPACAIAQAWQVGDDSMHLYNRDLNMNSAAGRAALLLRVERAAKRLCRDTPDGSACARQTLALVMQGPAGTLLRLAVHERTGIELAKR